MVGGNPLALRLVVGQLHVHALPVVLEALTLAQGQSIEQLYTYIYRQAWEALPQATRIAFLATALLPEPGERFAYLNDISGLSREALYSALHQLVRLNLLDRHAGEDLSSNRYAIHSLTRTFLMEQVRRWQDEENDSADDDSGHDDPADDDPADDAATPNG